MPPKYKYKTPERSPEERHRYDAFIKLASEAIREIRTPGRPIETPENLSPPSQPASYTGSMPWLPDDTIDQLIVTASRPMPVSPSSPKSPGLVERQWDIEVITDHWRDMWRLIKLELTGSLFLVQGGDSKECYVARTTEGWYEAYDGFLGRVLVGKNDDEAVKRIREGATETEGEWEDLGKEIFGDSD